MCDYCSCRSMPVIDDLGVDHEKLLDLSVAVRTRLAAGAHESARSVFDELLTLLGRHTAVEEASVFAVLRAGGDVDEHVDALQAEHEATWAAVSALATESWDAGALSILDELAEHIRREEYDVFPATLVCIPTAAWDEMDRAAREVRSRAS